MLATEGGDVASGGGLPTRQGLVLVGERADVALRARAACGPAAELLDDQQPGGRQVLQVVDEHVAVARADARAHVRALAQQPQRAQDEVAGVERALLGQEALVGEVQLRELALAGSVGLLRPRREALRVDQLLLQPVDASDHAGHERGRARAQVVLPQRQVVEALEEHREPVGAAERHDERVQAGLERLVVQQSRTEVVDGVDVQLLVGILERVLEQRRMRAAAGGAATSTRIASGSRPPATSRRNRSTSAVVLPVPAPRRRAAARRHARPRVPARE